MKNNDSLSGGVPPNKGIDPLKGALKEIAKKDSKGKLNYELDWEFIDGMAKNMQKNKDKYSKNNWKKPLGEEDFDSLEDSIFRHWRKYKQPVHGDEESLEEHLYAIACNAMMVWYQIKNIRVREANLEENLKSVND